MSEYPYFAVRKQWGFRIAGETGRKLFVSDMNNGDDTGILWGRLCVATMSFQSISYMTRFHKQYLWGHKISSQHVNHLHIRIEEGWYNITARALESFTSLAKHKETPHYNCHIRYLPRIRPIAKYHPFFFPFHGIQQRTVFRLSTRLIFRCLPFPCVWIAKPRFP